MIDAQRELVTVAKAVGHKTRAAENRHAGGRRHLVAAGRAAGERVVVRGVGERFELLK
jgi:hypothetical protein